MSCPVSPLCDACGVWCVRKKGSGKLMVLFALAKLVWGVCECSGCLPALCASGDFVVVLLKEMRPTDGVSAPQKKTLVFGGWGNKRGVGGSLSFSHSINGMRRFATKKSHREGHRQRPSSCLKKVWFCCYQKPNWCLPTFVLDI